MYIKMSLNLIFENISLRTGLYAAIGSGIAVTLATTCPHPSLNLNCVRGVIGGVGTYMSIKYLS